MTDEEAERESWERYLEATGEWSAKRLHDFAFRMALAHARGQQAERMRALERVIEYARAMLACTTRDGVGLYFLEARDNFRRELDALDHPAPIDPDASKGTDDDG